jgi:hypothetical protein
MPLSAFVRPKRDFLELCVFLGRMAGSERHACRLVGLGRSTHRYRVRKAEGEATLRARLKELAAKRMRFGHRRLTAILLREGIAVNHKHRIASERG